jgi:hypothetical protein
MNNIFKQLLLFAGIIITVGMLSCDELENLFINAKISQEITGTGVDPLDTTATFCLSDFDEISDYEDDIEAITYVVAAFRTISSTPGLTGDIFVSIVSDDDGVTIFSFTILDAHIEDYIESPYELELTQAEIDLFNSYLADYATKDCYTATLSVTNITAESGPPYTLTAIIEIVLEIEATL